MAKESLDSDRVNYMIWRYLIDSGYQETAVRLQKEWNTQNPPQLSCAPHLPNHALVTLLNRGLLYSVIEREDAQLDPQGAPVEAGFFGPLTPMSTGSAPRERDVDEDEFENARKRQVDDGEHPQMDHGPAAKRARLSNDYENGFVEQPTPMDLDEEDPNQQLNQNQNPHLNLNLTQNLNPSSLNQNLNQNGDENAYPSPEQAPSPVVATVGPEQGIQVDKVAELSTETTFLDLSDDQAAARNNNAVLLQCEWNPRDPSILAAAGTDALARMWTIPAAAVAAADDADTNADRDVNNNNNNNNNNNVDADSDFFDSAQRKPRFQPHQNLLPASAPPTTTVTGLAWSSDGASLAVSSEPLDDGTAKIDYWTAGGTPLASFNSFESPVICLRWNPSNTACLSLSPEDGSRGTVATVMYPSTELSYEHVLPRHSLHEQLLDVAWTTNDEFILGGGDFLQGFHCLDGAISPTRKFETREGHLLSKVTFDWHSRLLATASDTGTIDIWNDLGQCHSFNAHQGVITSLSWQPLPFPSALGDDAERLLASAGEDGAISIWNARSTDIKSRCSMTMGSSVVSLAFSPDGVFIAGATTDRIFVWKVDDPALPRATWALGDQLGWRTPMSQDSSADENQYSLSWDAHGQKLAYGVGTSLAVINFRR